MIVVRKVLHSEYPKYKDHLLALDDESKRTRFAYQIKNEAIEKFCDRVTSKPDEHILFCVEDADLNFIAVCHIALEQGTMELAFSVLKEHQKKGLGDALMTRAIEYCRTHNIYDGKMICLPTNAAIKKLCTKHGIAVQSDYGEATADIHLSEPELSTFIGEAANVNLAVFDYIKKRVTRPWALLAQ